MFYKFKVKANALGKFNNKIMLHPLTMLFQLVLAFTIVLIKKEVTGAVIFGTLVMMQLVFCESILPSTYSVLLMSVFLTRCYDSYDTFIKFAWVAIPCALTILFHFIVYAKPFKIGPTFFGVVAVAVAVTFGGMGTITAKEYFNPVALYYVFMLGIVMVLAYVLIYSQIDKDEKTADIFAKILLLMGVLACFCVLSFYFFEFKTIIKEKELLSFQSSNNLSTFIMISLPITFGFARKNKAFLIISILFYLCIILTGSRGGLLMGTIELFVCLIWYYITDREHRIVNLGVIAFVIFLLAIFYFKWEGFYEHYFKEDAEGILNGLIRKDEARFKLLKYSIRDFKSNILFGRGLGYSGNTDAYKPVKGALYWYHMWGPQVIGSMGLLGVFAYGYQFLNRFFVTYSRRGKYTDMLYMSYIGLFLMSQVNPGEFCPIPYELIAVMTFIVIEKTSIIKNKV